MTKLLPYMGNFTKMRELRLSWNEIEELPVQVFFHFPIQSNSFLAKRSNTDKKCGYAGGKIEESYMPYAGS